MLEKPSPAAIRALAGALPEDARIEPRKMFGMDAAFVGGQLFAGVFGRGVTLRLGRARAATLVGTDGVYPFAPGGRTWPEYALVDGETWGGTPDLKAWMAEALAHTAALPAKVPAPKKGPGKGRRLG